MGDGSYALNEFRMGISTTLLVTYGKHIKSLDDPYLHDVKMAGESFNKAAIPGEHLIEMLPFLLYIPGAAKKSLDFVKEYKPYVVAVKEGPYAEVKTAVVRYFACKSQIVLF